MQPSLILVGNRWSRTVHALNMGREYSEPFKGLGRSYPDEIGQLCGFVCMLGCAFGLGIGQAVSICGNYGVNFAACFTCHAREKLRRCAFPAQPLALLPSLWTPQEQTFQPAEPFPVET
jgi:hypothetical protein